MEGLKILLAIFAAAGSLTALGFLFRNLTKAPSTIRTSENEVYTRFSCNLSHFITGSVAVLWGLAAWSAFSGPGLGLPLYLMLSPMVVAIVAAPLAQWWFERRGAEVPQFAVDMRAKANELKARHDAGEISGLEFRHGITGLRRELRARASVKRITYTPDEPSQ